MRDLEDAVGQFVVYRSVLAQVEAQRTLYLAIRSARSRESSLAGERSAKHTSALEISRCAERAVDVLSRRES